MGPTPSKDMASRLKLCLSTAVTMITGVQSPCHESAASEPSTPSKPSSDEREAAEGADKMRRLMNYINEKASKHQSRSTEYVFKRVPRPCSANGQAEVDVLIRAGKDAEWARKVNMPGHDRTIPIRPLTKKLCRHVVSELRKAVKRGRVSRRALIDYYAEKPQPSRVAALSEGSFVQSQVLTHRKSKSDCKKAAKAKRRAIHNGWRVGSSPLNQSWTQNEQDQSGKR